MTINGHTNFEDVIDPITHAQKLTDLTPSSFKVARDFWQASVSDGHLSARIKELVLIALHASSTSLNTSGIERHIARAQQAGASQEDILDVLISVVGLANHALYFALPILMDELHKHGHPAEDANAPLLPEVQALKDDFIQTRGFWNDKREQLAREMPDYFIKFSALSAEPWKNGSLSPKEREFIYIAIDCSITHMHEFGLRMHIQNALKHGATKHEILEIFQLSSLMGLESYIVGSQELIK